MTDFDLILTGARVVTASGVQDADIGVTGSTISAVAAPGTLAQSTAARVVRLGPEHVVLPGGIDPHIHCDDPIPDFANGGWNHSEGPAKVGRAALHGGVTSIIDFVTSDHEKQLSESLAPVVEHWERDSPLDYGFHVILHGDVPEHHLEEIPELIREGFTSYKVFTTDVRPTPFVSWQINQGSLVELLEITRDHGGMVAVHAEDNDIVMREYRLHMDSGRTGVEYMSAVHNSLSEELAIERVVAAARRVPGSKMYIMHVSSGPGIEVVRRARREPGLRLHAETLPQFSLRTDDVYREEDGLVFHTFPSLKSQDDVDELWASIATGDIEVMATDELCTPRDVKLSGRQIHDAVGGNTGLEPRLALLYTEVVGRRGMDLEKLADLTARNAAKIFGMYPQKGEIAVGSDADLVVLDTSDARIIDNLFLHESDYTPWQGTPVDAWPCLTVLRGTVVVDSGEMVAEPGGRRVVRRPDAPAPTGRVVAE